MIIGYRVKKGVDERFHLYGTAQDGEESIIETYQTEEEALSRCDHLRNGRRKIEREALRAEMAEIRQIEAQIREELRRRRN